jgi:hypothetical protein
MRVEQAIYGEVEGTHSLRVASGEEQFAREIANRMDLPEATPAGTTWSSFVSGFPFRRHYVIARTFPDPTATRGGMVFAHALIAPLDEICHWRHIGGFFERLVGTGKWGGNVASLDINEDPTGRQLISEIYGIANALATRGPLPVIRLGCEGFENVVTLLWANLWPEARKQFSFRLSFGPDDLYETPRPAIVCTPSSLAGRWAHSRIATPSDKELHSTTARILSGSVDASHLLDFGRKLPANLGDIDVLRQLESIESLFHSDAVDKLLAAVRFIDNVSLSSTGSVTKSDIVNRLASAMKTGTCENVLAMRNLEFLAFPFPESVWSAMETWVEKREFRSHDDACYETMLAAVIEPGGASAQWRLAFLSGFGKAAQAKSHSLANGIWRWLLDTKLRPSELFGLLPRQPDLDGWLANEAPGKINHSLGEELAKLALGRGWFILHGAVLSAFLKPLDAVSRQIGIDHAAGSLAGVRAALRDASDQDIVDCALGVADHRLIDIAASLVANEPAILANADYTRTEVQKLWVAAIGKNTAAWTAPSDPVATRNNILEDFVSGSRDVGAVEILSETPLADLGGYPGRERLWTRLKGKTQGRYLEATARGWMIRARNGEEGYTPDVRLQSQILGSQELAEMLQGRSNEVGVVIRAIEMLNSFPEDRFIDWITVLERARIWLSASQSDALGQLVLVRHWQKVCDALLSMHRRGKYDLKAALVACSDMLSSSARWRLSILAPTQSEKWEVFAQVAANLYPNGPTDREVWARAGGRNADIRRDGDGATVWRQALYKVRFGHKPSARSLLEEMLNDFHGNEELRFLLADSDISGY